MVRALCAEIPPHEAIGTFETEYELHLHEMPDQHPIVHAWEARPGSGERGADGRQAGEFSIDEALYDSFRFNLSRQIVGEVRGREVIAMIKAMESGAGSISTTHAGNAAGGVAEAGDVCDGGRRPRHPRVRHPSDRGEHRPGGAAAAGNHRWPAVRRAGTGGCRRSSPSPGASGRRVCDNLRVPAGAGRIAVAGVLPDEYRDLERHGFDLRGFYAESSQVAS